MQTELEKEFVPYNEAVQMKELGFNEPCFGGFGINSSDWYWHPDSDIITDCPTYSQAFRWFRKNLNVAFEIKCDNDFGLGYVRGYAPYIAIDNKSRTEPIYNNNDCFETYELAELFLLQKLILCKKIN